MYIESKNLPCCNFLRLCYEFQALFWSSLEVEIREEIEEEEAAFPCVDRVLKRIFEL